ncbi:MAG: hypothetical protein GX605_01720 [Chloroflexi bacterium]|nr:hypothetical protein [Chloroflexota bacterium]
MQAIRNGALLLLVGTAITLAVVVGKGLSPDAGALLMGVAAGFLASLPACAVAILWGARRQRQEPPAPPPPTAPPPTVIMLPGAAAGAGWPSGYPTYPRQFVGQDDEDEG